MYVLYCSRGGFVTSDHCTEVATVSLHAVMLQPFDPNSPDKNKHKFMVQTMFAPPDFVPDQLDAVVSQREEEG